MKFFIKDMILSFIIVVPLTMAVTWLLGIWEWAV